MRLRIFLAVAFTSCALFSACAHHEYRYKPNDAEAVFNSETKGAIYALPLEARQGSMQISSLGVADVSPSKDAPSERVLQMRMHVSRDKTQSGSWFIDAGDQAIAFAAHGTLQPAWVNTDTKGLPRLKIEPGQELSVDLYFKLPDALKSADEIPAFQFQWKLVMSDRTEVESTSFERIEVHRPVATLYPYAPYYPYDYPMGLGWGPIWWRRW